MAASCKYPDCKCPYVCARRRKLTERGARRVLILKNNDIYVTQQGILYHIEERVVNAAQARQEDCIVFEHSQTKPVVLTPDDLNEMAVKLSGGGNNDGR